MHPHIKVADFALTTGTDPLRKHLADHHTDAWISACDKLEIKITAKSAQRAVHEYRQRQHQSSEGDSSTESKSSSHTFSQEAFVDAIVEFIVADDQVCHLQTHFVVYMFSRSSSPSTLSNVSSYVPSSSCSEKSSRTPTSPIAQPSAIGSLRYGMNILIDYKRRWR